jgi:hypothetical protein
MFCCISNRNTTRFQILGAALQEISAIKHQKSLYVPRIWIYRERIAHRWLSTERKWIWVKHFSLEQIDKILAKRYVDARCRHGWNAAEQVPLDLDPNRAFVQIWSSTRNRNFLVWPRVQGMLADFLLAVQAVWCAHEET